MIGLRCWLLEKAAHLVAVKTFGEHMLEMLLSETHSG
jgi:hypothetical protein